MANITGAPPVAAFQQRLNITLSSRQLVFADQAGGNGFDPPTVGQLWPPRIRYVDIDGDSGGNPTAPGSP